MISNKIPVESLGISYRYRSHITLKLRNTPLVFVLLHPRRCYRRCGIAGLAAGQHVGHHKKARCFTLLHICLITSCHERSFSPAKCMCTYLRKVICSKRNRSAQGSFLQLFKSSGLIALTYLHSVWTGPHPPKMLEPVSLKFSGFRLPRSGPFHFSSPCPVCHSSQ